MRVEARAIRALLMTLVFVGAPPRRLSQAGAPVTAPLPCGPRVLPDGADSLDVAMVGMMSARQMPGLSLAIVERGQVRAVRAYGWADLESCVPVTDSTLFGIGSISKQFTAVGALLLVQLERLKLIVIGPTSPPDDWLLYPSTAIL